MSLRDLVLWNKKNSDSIKRDSFDLFDSFQREVDRVFGEFGSFSKPFFGRDTFGSFSPKVDVSENEKSINISAELPGMEEKDIEVILQDQILTIKGEKKNNVVDKENESYRTERRYGSFQRSLRVPDEIEADSITASFKNGVLNVLLPKSEKAQEKVRQIEVTAA